MQHTAIPAGKLSIAGFVYVSSSIVIAFILLLAPQTAVSTETESLLAQTLNASIPHCLQHISEEAPEWFKRTDFALHFEEHLKPLWAVESIQPLYQTPGTLRHTFFTQDRFSHTGDDDTMNLGLGYRLLLPDNHWLLGAHGFYDHTFDRRHNRFGVGGHIISEWLSLYANYYEAFSPRRYYSEDGARVSERALDGWDIEGTLQAPWLPWAEINMKGYGWQGYEIKDVSGFRISGTLYLSKWLTLEFGRSYDRTACNNFLQFNCSIGGPERVEYTLIDNTFGKTFFTRRHLEKQTLAKVRRTHTVVVEKIRSAAAGGPSVATGGIFIGRAS